MENHEYDDPITEIIKNSEYLTMWEEELTKNSWRYDGEQFLSLPIPTTQIISQAKFELESAESRLNLYKNNLAQYIYMAQTTGLQYALINIELYQNLVGQTSDNINAAKYVLEKSCVL